jgi:hypothetical protein
VESLFDDAPGQLDGTLELPGPARKLDVRAS